METDTTLQLAPRWDAFIQRQLQAGQFHSANEVVHAALALLEAQEARKTALFQALEAGENAGFIENFDSTAFISHLAQKHAAPAI